MKLNEIIDNCTVDLIAATKESDKVQQQRLIQATLCEFRANIAKLVGENMELSERMTINEYQDKFNKLFKRLQIEHGRPKRVCIEADYINDDLNEPIGCLPVCSIEF